MKACRGNPSADGAIDRSNDWKTPAWSSRDMRDCTVLRERPSFSASATTVARGSALSAAISSRSTWSREAIAPEVTSALRAGMHIMLNRYPDQWASWPQFAQKVNRPSVSARRTGVADDPQLLPIHLDDLLRSVADALAIARERAAWDVPQHAADEAAVRYGDDGRLAGVLRDRDDGREGAVKQFVVALGVGDVGAGGESRPVLGDRQALRDAVAALLEAVELLRAVEPERLADDLRGLARPRERARHEAGVVAASKRLGGCCGLRATRVVEGDVAVALQPPLAVPVGLSMAYEGDDRHAHEPICRARERPGAYARGANSSAMRVSTSLV